MSLTMQQQAAAELLRRRRARSSPIAFAEFVYVPGRPVEDEDEANPLTPVETLLAQHHKMILEEVDLCFNTPNGRLMIFMPPGSAKSTYASVVSPAYLMGKHPKTRVGLFSYADTLALKMGRRTRSIINQKRYKGVFDVTLSAESAAVNNFTLTNGSEYMATGILGAATGNRFELVVIDDPVKGREQADSETIREKTWGAYEDDIKTRLVPGGSMMVIQCMIGSTAVLMADGTERALRDIRPGDMIATYDNGKMSKSVVRNWANQGSDCVFAIKTSSGKIAVANKRHPFLVERNGDLIWVRLKDLTAGDAIIRATASAEHGPASNAQSMGAASQPSAKGIAHPTTAKPDGQADTVRRPSTPILTDQPTLNTGTGSPLLNTKQCLNGKPAAAQCATCRQVRTSEHTGAASSALITATTPEKCEACCATIAISPLDTERHQPCCSSHLTTYGFTKDRIVEIVAAGREDVFDIQVDRTENFIANGFVSHNTRWHEDDLSGRILPEDWDGESGDILCKDGNVWRVLCIQAQCETDTDPLGRQRGEMLWPEWFTEKHWAQFRPNARTWGSLFQQLPKPKDGNMFNPDKIRMIETLPAGSIKWVRGWDLAATEGGGAWTAGGLIGVHQESGRVVIADMQKAQYAPGKRDEFIKNIVVADGRSIKQDFPDDPGAAGTAVIEYLVKKLKGYSVVWGPESGSKEQRAEPLAAEVNIGNVDMVVGDWNAALKNELRGFPNGTYKDQVDALTRGYTRLVPLPGKMTISKTLLNRIRK